MPAHAKTDVRTTSTEPKVSVCIPTRNGARFLKGALSSVLGDAGESVQLVVVDNDSSDDTDRVVEELQAANARLEYHKNERDLGLVGNFNQCLKYARGDYVTLLCVDDLLLPGFIAALVAALDDHPGAAIAAAGRRIVDGERRPITTLRYRGKSGLVDGKEAARTCLIAGNRIGEPSAVMLRKSLCARGFDDRFPHLADLEMWLHLLQRGDLAVVAEPLCEITRHSGQLTNLNIQSGALVDDNIRLYETYGKPDYTNWKWPARLEYRCRMAWRLWLCRAALSDDRRSAVLDHYASRTAYRLMPMIAVLVRLGRKVIRVRHIWTRDRTSRPGVRRA